MRPVALTLALWAAAPALAETAFAPGSHGEPFAVQGLMQGCYADEEGEYCLFTAEGWRWLVEAGGPTPPDLYRLLTVLPVNAPIEVTGDMIEMGDVTVNSAVSDVTAGRDGEARLRALLQGTWTFGSAEQSVQIEGAEWASIVDGNFEGVSIMQLRRDCGDGVDAGGTVITLVPMGGDPENLTCHLVAEATLDTVTLRDGRGGAGDLVMTRLD
jgi:hypothetical protein